MGSRNAFFRCFLFYILLLLFSVNSFADYFVINEHHVEADINKINLLSFIHSAGVYDDSVKPYNRKQHFGGWVRDPKDSSCQNTRAKVLIRDSLEPVTFHPGTCRVAQGDWKDPYGGEDFFDAQQIQIDHMVPLKNAYISGAWSWDFNKRCLYGNFLGNKFHLIAVSGHENQSKSDKTPEFYLPKVSVYQCEYIENWLKIKLIWQLKLSESEALAIQNLAQKLSCPKEDFYFTDSDLQQQRQFIQQNMGLCDGPGTIANH